MTVKALKVIYYRNYKNFNRESLFNNLERENFDLQSKTPNKNYSFPIRKLIEIISMKIVGRSK